MKENKYSRDNTPKQGDIVWINFDPSKGKEIKKKRPALILSTDEYNKATGMIVVCPITSTERAEFIEIDEIQKVSGFINPLQIKTFDYKIEARKVEYIEYLNDRDMADVIQIVDQIFNFGRMINIFDDMK
ncbi:type II toxin-antitoxin system PemK/MazF family toxin [Marinilactibacillus psychrotolerans]|uniref:Type II toxin-antitoxin system PemK/MazF family toxin n=2 Tax=Marinilactibacillus psychrotolerans TaxID=191770 RepID=A0A5R9C141_9LACT|nr:type II toxin-antitoxin system PemK/MazF family toxin [Marinilactibacillus psychrotolerans]TLQ06416.1 type II toxin-antitoxin system PemK/MazF family toxin [Marinilactibacillus psychrotolerans]GEQ33362.1 toxin-antitoxin addiction module toxin component MazF [Marinilactibacillus psychrotolerans]SJN26403.1 Programmed cell death toxin MazF [Marinilactibacillus psychrotolerans 42ea]